MNLNIETWETKDISLFLEYIETFKNSEEKIQWAKRLLKTDSAVLGMKTQDIVTITTQLLKGNYISFLDLEIVDYYETIAIYGILLSKIESFSTYLLYLDKYLNLMNSWAHCDLLTFPQILEKKETYLQLAETYSHDTRVMVRRLSLYIMFKLLKTEDNILYILNHLLRFQNEEEYYVIMMAGWLLSECIILQEEQTINFIQNHNINKKIINKGIQKCRESNRLSKDKKDWLLQFKK